MPLFRRIALGLAVVLLAVGCERRADDNLSMDLVRAENAPSQESWGAHFFVTEVPADESFSRVRLEMKADYLARYEREDSTYMLLRGHPDSLRRRVTAYFYDDAGDSSATLTANRVLYFDKEQRFEARGDVVVITTDDKRLETEHLLWYESERKVRTPAFVRITMPTEQVQGYGLEADEDLASYQLGRVTAQVQVEDEL